MPYPMKLASVLSGVTPSQLRRLQRKGIIVPRERDGGARSYSFNDVLALRAFATLRPYISAQKIDKAFSEFHRLMCDESTAELSSHRFGTDGTTIFTDLPDADGTAMDLLTNPGQMTVFTFDQLTREFKDWKGRTVPDLRNPRHNLAVDEGCVGGWPTVRGTRIPYDTIALMANDEDMTYGEIRYYYPRVSEAAVRDAVDLDHAVRAVRA